MSQDPHAKRQPGAPEKKLEVFVGRWKVEGKNHALAPNDPETPVSGEESYELLPGGFFLLSRFEHRAANSAHVGTSVIGSAQDQYRLDSFDNLGYHRTYELSAEGQVWTIRGEHERARQAFDPSGNHFDIAWEIRKHGERWQPLCTLRATRVR
jgi:hypothetical protein